MRALAAWQLGTGEPGEVRPVDLLGAGGDRVELWLQIVRGQDVGLIQVHRGHVEAIDDQQAVQIALLDATRA
ncbi:hypothetical protein D3C75_1300420 [compost metagenome]